MTLMALLGNLIWILFGGALGALFWFAAGVLFAISIVGLPWALAAFRIGYFTLLPFGSELTEQPSSGVLGDSLRTVVKIIWIVLAGFWLALFHVFVGFLFLITIIGFPFAMVHFKLAQVAFEPVGKTIVRP